MSQRVHGRKTFWAGALVLVLFGAVHLLAVYEANFTMPTDPAELKLRTELQNGVIFEAGPIRATAAGAVQILSASYSVLLMQAGVLNLLMARVAAEHGRLRKLTAANIVFVGLLLVITVIFQFPPPMVFAAAAWILFVVSLVQQRRRTNGQIP